MGWLFITNIIEGVQKMIDSKILIVEDEYIVAKDLKQRLEDIGYEIVGIESNGKSAIKKLLKQNLI